MSYKCEVCRVTVPPKQPKKVFRTYRETVKGLHKTQAAQKQIDREVAVCSNCLHNLEGGASLQELTYYHSPAAPAFLKTTLLGTKIALSTTAKRI